MNTLIDPKELGDPNMKAHVAWSRTWFLVLLATFFIPTSVGAQALNRMATFTSSGGRIEFLPGAYVAKTEDSRKQFYAYDGSAFHEYRGPVPPEIANWISFDWESTDYLDQVNRRDFDPSIGTFVPNSAKVKKVLSIPLSNQRGTLVLICYTERSTAQFVSPDTTDIFVTGLLDSELDQHKKANYHKLWTKKVQTESDYGQFTFEDVPRVGTFILLYSAEVGGDSVDRTLEVYSIR